MKKDEFIEKLTKAVQDFEKAEKENLDQLFKDLDAYKKNALKEIEGKVHTQEEQKMANLEKELADLA